MARWRLRKEIPTGQVSLRSSDVFSPSKSSFTCLFTGSLSFLKSDFFYEDDDGRVAVAEALKMRARRVVSLVY